MLVESVELIFVHLGRKIPRYAIASLDFAAKNAKIPIVLISDIKNPPRINKQITHYYYSYNESDYSIDTTKSFRDGFWQKTTLRFFALEEYMRSEKKDKCFHAELDNLIFDISNVSTRLDALGRGMFIPSDHVDRAIGSLIYINSLNVYSDFCSYARSFNFLKNDMEILAGFLKKKPSSAFPLPCKPLNQANGNSSNSTQSTKDVISSVGLFDGAAIGQWYFGIDPRNSYSRITNQFVNELYDGELQDYHLEFNELNSELRLQSKSSNYSTFRLNNLHVHSKIHVRLLRKKNLNKIIHATNRNQKVIIAWNIFGKVRFVKDVIRHVFDMKIVK